MLQPHKSLLSEYCWCRCFNIKKKSILLTDCTGTCKITLWRISRARSFIAIYTREFETRTVRKTILSQVVLLRDDCAFTWFCISCCFIHLPAAVCLSLGHFLGRVLAGVIMSVRYRGHRLLQHLHLVVLFSCQQILHVVILILTSGAIAKFCKPHEESQQSQGH